MDKTPVYDPSMTPMPTTPGGSATTVNVLQPKAMVYICGECHKENELKSTDVIRCKKIANDEYFDFSSSFFR